MAFMNDYAINFSITPGRPAGAFAQGLVQAFRKAEFNGRFKAMLARLLGRSTDLLDLNAARSRRTQGQRAYAGARTVAIRAIRGSEGRCEDFDQQFNPRRSQDLSRWLSVAQARMNGVSLPPVELIQVGDIYYVRDGHHRVSVAKALGEEFIDAVVTKE